jgi:formylglycine-generating enzyme required for sulfatase activity
VKDSTSIAQLEVIATRYKGTVYADLAQARIAELKKQQTALAAPPAPKPPIATPPAPAPKPEPAVGAFDPSRKAVPLTPAEERALKPGDSFKECDTCPEMVVVPAGSFTMGSPVSERGRSSAEGPQRRVMIARPFAVGRFEVTRGEFTAFAEKSGWRIGDKCSTYENRRWEERPGRSFRNPGFEQDHRHPAVCISWQDATAFASWLTNKTGKSYRLVSESEWEYAARAGTTTRYHFGDDEQARCAYGNVGSCEFRRFRFTAPVGSYRPNAFGLHDMYGNMHEWVGDCRNESYDGAPSDGSAWTTGDCAMRIMRGGFYASPPESSRSASRSWEVSDYRSILIGFRVGRVLDR